MYSSQPMNDQEIVLESPYNIFLRIIRKSNLYFWDAWNFIDFIHFLIRVFNR